MATTDPSTQSKNIVVKVDVIIAVHNAETTIDETVRSALNQGIPEHLLNSRYNYIHKESSEDDNEKPNNCVDDGGMKQNVAMSELYFDVCVCCYNDASTDKSLDILHSLQKEYDQSSATGESPNATKEDNSEPPRFGTIQTRLLVGTSPKSTSSRGAGYARNQAVKLRDNYEIQRKEMQDKSHVNRTSNCRQNAWRHFLCILDSDDIMHPTRISEQTSAMLALGYQNHKPLCERTLMGSQFDRIPKDSTWHYSQWANSLTNERLYLEQFRECTLVQPTWFFSKAWFERLGKYLEAPASNIVENDVDASNPAKRAKLDLNNGHLIHNKIGIPESSANGSRNQNDHCGLKRKLVQNPENQCMDVNANETVEPSVYQLIHPSEVADQKCIDDLSNKVLVEATTLRLAEDSRFFYTHLHAGGKLHLHRTETPLVSYRHRSGMSQSSNTPRKLLMKLRAKAWEDLVFYGKRFDERSCNVHDEQNLDSNDSSNGCTIWAKHGFAIWGAGRDGKDFLKALSPDVASRVVCFVDVDQKKIEQIKWYDNSVLGLRIPIFHFSKLAKHLESASDLDETVIFGRINKRFHVDSFSLTKSKSEEDAELPGNISKRKERKKANIDGGSIDSDLLSELPVVVCVAMYRTNGALESNVSLIGRIEGKDLWHIN